MRTLQEQITELYRKVRHIAGRSTTPNKYTTVQRNAIANPVEGKIIYNTDLRANQYWNGTEWTTF